MPTTNFPNGVQTVIYDAAGLQVVGAQQAAISDPAGGATTDAEARAAIASILDALKAHGLIAT